jgi:sugar O-acyltransferase (sialic acid O-acetyltransferase NeuD family)
MNAGSAAEPLLIVGAGGFARETSVAAQVDGRWQVVGFLDDDPELHGRRFGGIPVLGGLGIVARHPNARVVVCTGNPRNWWSRRHLVDRLALPDERFATIVHPAAVLAAGTELGPGCVVLAGAVATAAVTVGAHVAVMPHATLTHDDVVEDDVTIASGVRLGGGALVRSGAYLGAGCLIREGVTVGAGAQVGMGSTVLADIPPGEVWVGSPARFLRAAPVPIHLLSTRT